MATVEPSTAIESAGGASAPVRAPDQPTRIVPRGQQPEGIVCGNDSGGDSVFDDRFHAQLTVGPIDHTVHLLPLTVSERRTVIHAGEARADVDAGMAAAIGVAGAGGAIGSFARSAAAGWEWCTRRSIFNSSALWRSSR